MNPEHSDPLSMHQLAFSSGRALIPLARLWFPSCCVARNRKCWVHCALASSEAICSISSCVNVGLSFAFLMITISSFPSPFVSVACTAFGRSGWV
eukprot:CAMPEP_0179057286 /NCGR_PEP_ID=MMETSP0796-20121207/24256_1 /TAXON_ID=73915 /ORGANISM="Pyrodinium bahamense, Strain pbaha01" /LENGTH=94 /DNA_ID=CAMNT_0020754001 /DNA_START=1 /DNA_END=281 /DNA_ORIENTATION=+